MELCRDSKYMIRLFLPPRRLCFHLRELVSLLPGFRKNYTQPIFTAFGGKVADGPRKNPTDFGGNADDVTLGLGLG